MILANPTHERFKIQYDSIVYDFKPKSMVEVPEWPKTIGEGLLKKTFSMGIYEIKPGMSDKEIDAAEKNGLKRFLEGYLKASFNNHQTYQDAVVQSGRTLTPDYHFLKVQKDRKEIAEFIGYEAEKIGDTSYLPKKVIEKDIKKEINAA